MKFDLKSKITIWLLKNLFQIDPKISRRFLLIITNLRLRNGLPFCIKYIKSSRLHITRYICGKPLLTNKDLVSLTNGFPTKFLFLKGLLDTKDLIKIRGVLTLLYFTRSIVPTKLEESRIKPDFSSITNEYKGKDYSIPMYFINDWVKINNLGKTLPKFGGNLHYISSKGSPFGKATITGPFALFYMVQASPKMLEYFLRFIGEGSYKLLFGNFIEKLWKDHRLMTPGKVIGSLGKISIVRDPELKRRPIAMLDYNSQMILKPIHDDLLNNLRSLSQDRTFTQDPNNKWSPRGNSFWSIDLSSATDRFPISLQVKLISAMYNNRDFAETWKNILVDRDFRYNDTSLRYKVGQPMGAYSSWGCFTLCHHLVVAWAAHLCGLSKFKDYIILGDDIVINNDKVARKYIALMAKLGVDISLQKTHVSFNTYEFAKRWICKRVEISPLPLKGILLNIKYPQVVLQQLMIYMNNNNHYFKGGVLELVIKLYTGLKVGRRFYTSSSINKIVYDFYYVLRFAFNTISNQELKQYLISKNIKNYLLPSDELIPVFMRELLVLGLGAQAEKAGNDISKIANEFLDPYLKFDNFEITDLSGHPLTHGLYNKTEQIRKDMQRAINSKDFDLIDIISSMRVEKVDKIVSMMRNHQTTVQSLDKLWRNSLYILKNINENNFMNYPYPSCGQTPNYKIWESNFNSNLSTSKDVLELLRIGHYNKPGSFQAMW